MDLWSTIEPHWPGVITVLSKFGAGIRRGWNMLVEYVSQGWEMIGILGEIRGYIIAEARKMLFNIGGDAMYTS